MAPRLSRISEALDEISYQWMVDTHPLLTEAIEQEVGRGAQSQQIRRHVMAQTQRPDLARRCEQVARFLGRRDEGP